ncbi:hypothetical protein D3C85_127470 [compost metagenome]
MSFNLNDKDLKQNTINRLGLSSLDKKWNIKFNSLNIEIDYSEDINQISEFNTDEFINKAVEFLTIINSKFPKKHTRLGFVVQSLVNKIDSKTTFDKLNVPIDFFKADPPIEWTNKIVTRKLIELGMPEIFNISNNINWINANLVNNNTTTAFEGLHVTIDINTLQENNTNRFELDNVVSFLEKANEMYKTIDEQNLLTFK